MSDIYIGASGSGGGGSGTVTQINTGTGLTGGPITNSGTISVATATANTLAGYNNSGVFSDVAIGTGLSLSGGTLTATGGGGGVSSFTGDGVFLSNSASTGAVTASLETWPAYTTAANNTASTAAPTSGVYLRAGIQTLSSNTSLTASSPVFNVITGGTITLPQASTCIGKELVLINGIASTAITIAAFSGDEIYYSGSGETSTVLNSSTTINLLATASAKWQIIQQPSVWSGSGSGFQWSVANGIVYTTYYQSSPSVAATAAGSAGQLLQSGPSFTSTPGSAGALTSITVGHLISAGTAPTVAVGAGAGTGSPSASITGHDSAHQVTVNTGTVASGGVVCTITFGTAYGSAPGAIVFSPANASAAALTGLTMVYVSSPGSTSYSLTSGTTGVSSSSTYIWNVMVQL
jgi:hypothetical protein